MAFREDSTVTKDRVDLRQDVRIVKRQHPASVAHIVVVEDSQALNRFLSPQAFAPYVERDLCIYFPRVGKIVCIKDEGLSFCVENAAKCALGLAVAISVVDIDNVEIARDYQFSDVACFRREPPVAGPTPLSDRRLVFEAV